MSIKEVTLYYFIHLFGIRPIAERYLGEFFKSMKTYSKATTKVKLFLLMIGYKNYLFIEHQNHIHYIIHHLIYKYLVWIKHSFSLLNVYH